MISIAQPLLGKEEENAILRVLASGQLAQGPNVALFEQHFASLCGVKEAVAVASGTAALFLALLAHHVGPGDEVITTAFSFSATANAILHTGATPVFVDIDRDTYTIDPACVELAITPRTKAIIPVHLYGHPCEMQPLERLAKTHALALIEDACQAHGASIDSRMTGSFGTGCFSFYATKNMTTGEGGMVTTNDSTIAEQVRLLRNHGQESRYHQVIQGYNLRMTEMQAAIGLVQLEKLPEFTRKRIHNAQFLTTHLREYVQTPVVRPGYTHVFHQYTVRVPEKRSSWIAALHERGVGTAVHYPTPIHRQPFYQQHSTLFLVVGSDGASQKATQLSITDCAAQQVLSLPVHAALMEEDLTTIVKEVIALCR